MSKDMQEKPQHTDRLQQQQQAEWQVTFSVTPTPLRQTRATVLASLTQVTAVTRAMVARSGHPT